MQLSTAIHQSLSFLRRGITKLDRAIYSSDETYPPDFDQEVIATIGYVRAYTMTSVERIYALCEAISYISRCNIPGDVVECGVWRGGSMMAALRTLLQRGHTHRHAYLFDTFEGMPAPTENDTQFDGKPAAQLLRSTVKDENSILWAYAPLDAVRAAVYTTGYPQQNIHFVQGKVEDTLPDQAPQKIALLRLDTDWYESTAHELEHLFPRLVSGGVLIIDDYGHWQGARRAVDDYVAKHQLKLLFNRVDYTARIAIKP